MPPPPITLGPLPTDRAGPPNTSVAITGLFSPARKHGEIGPAQGTETPYSCKGTIFYGKDGEIDSRSNVSVTGYGDGKPIRLKKNPDSFVTNISSQCGFWTEFVDDPDKRNYARANQINWLPSRSVFAEEFLSIAGSEPGRQGDQQSAGGETA